MLALAVTAAWCGCNRTAPAPPPVAAAEVPATLEKAFAKAPPELAALAQAIAAAVRSQDPQALMALNELSARPGLTAEQRGAVSACLAGLLEQTRQTAAQGDAKAAAAIQTYRATK